MNTVYKFELNIGENILHVPFNAYPVHVGCQGENLFVWVHGTFVSEEVDSYGVWTLEVYATGQAIPGNFEDVCHIGTIQTPAGFVWHVFEEGFR